jgi:hypothetical protein
MAWVGEDLDAVSSSSGDPRSRILSTLDHILKFSATLLSMSRRICSVISGAGAC